MARPQGALFGINLLEGTQGISDKLTEARRYLAWKRKYAKKLRQFKDLHKGQDCFIIGNGPSLNKTDLAPLADYHTFGLNKIYLMRDRGIDLNLSYLVSVNELVIEQSKQEFEQMTCPTFLSHTAAHGKIDDKAHIHRLHTLNTWSFYEDIAQPICEGFTVTYVAMQIAYYMGFERVFIIGVDHSFKQSGNSNETQVYEGDDQNHFDPNYFKGQKWQLADVYGSECSFHLANYHYKKANRLILDATIGGKLDVFKKIDYAEALNIARKKR